MTEDKKIISVVRREYQESPSSYTVGSFDIGVRNLAVCILERITDSPGYRIRRWKLISLVCQVGKKALKCDHLVKKSRNDPGKICNKKATYWNPEDDVSQGYCGVHAKKKLAEEPNSLIRYTTTKNISDLELNQNIIDQIEKMPELWMNCNEIVIESQKRSDMKKVVYMILSYLTHKKMHIPDCQLNNLKIISASHKLSIPKDQLEIDLPNKTQDGQTKKSYDGRKILAKEHCNLLLAHDQRHLEYYQRQKKKDDLADCFLQGLWYLLKVSNN